MPRSLTVTSPLVVALAGLLTLAGCSGAPATPTGPAGPTNTAVASTDPPPTSGAPSAEGLCASFTGALATAALGGPVSSPTSGDVLPRPNGIYCHYNSADGSANAEAQLKEMTEADFDTLAETIATTDPVVGVGEKAFKRDSSITGDVGVTLAAFAAGRGVTVTIYNPSGQPAAMLEAAKTIAQAVLAH